MLTYFAHAGHEHASESATTNIPVVLGVAAVFIILIAAVIILDKKRAAKLKKNNDK